MAKYIAAGIAALFATAEGLELTPDNFEAEVKGSKNAFVKFQAPWCAPRPCPPPPKTHVARHADSYSSAPLPTYLTQH